MKNARLYYASGILPDGRVFVAGGEYNGGDTGVELDAAEVFDPVSGQWTDLPTPGWGHIGDAPCCILPDGRVLIGNIDSPIGAIWDPSTNKWGPTGSKGGPLSICSEETWTLLPDGSVLTAECKNHPVAKRYLPSANEWVPAGSIPASHDLVEPESIEIGPALLMPDGRVFALGATGHTALYTPDKDPSKPGQWTAGPDFENLRQAKDAPACLLPNGRVLCTVGTPAAGENYPGPTYFYEFDGNNLVRVADPGNGSDVQNGPFDSRMLLTPTGEVLFAKSGQIWVYTPDSASGGPRPEWAPQVTSAPQVIAPGGEYSISGYQLTGLSQAVCYGDDATMATNYPIVRIEVAGGVYYARTYSFSDLGVARGKNFVQSCTAGIPANLPHGQAMMTVIANAIPSKPFPVVISTIPAPPLNTALLNILGNCIDSGLLWLMDNQGPRLLLNHGLPPDPARQQVVEEVGKIYQDLISSIRRLHQIGREFVPPHQK
jgi:hypothetical protein